MKKWIALFLAAVLVLGLAACGSINQSDVYILWAGDGVVRVPNSLINAMERAMYIESISYQHRGANGDGDTQVKQAQDAIAAGCAALVVEPVDPSVAEQLVALAKEAGVPVVFINSAVDAAVVDSYDKCASVITDSASLSQVMGVMVGQAAAENFSKYDRNGDGVITCAGLEDAALAQVLSAANEVLAEKGKGALEAAEIAALDAIEGLTEDAVQVELILTASDESALEILAALQAKGYNSTRLVTHFVPLFTVGADADARAFTDTDGLTEQEKADLIFTAEDLVGNGQLSGAVLDDYDGIAGQAAALTAAFLRDKTPESRQVQVTYTTTD